MIEFKTIGLITKPDDIAIADTVRSLVTYLQQHDVEILFDNSTALLLEADNHSCDHNTIAEQCDIGIVIGGDGTLLQAARSLAPSGVPLLGINRGRLGFLVDISPDDMTRQLDAILQGHYRLEERCALYAEILRDGDIIASGHAYNDVVLHSREVIRMIEFDTTIDGRYLCTQRADGLIVSTPTGSTAYALSGGGPIIYPSLETVVLVPICPHTLSNRPLVISANSIIEISLCSQGRSARASFDGQINIELVPGDRICVRREQHNLQLVQPQNHDYFNILRSKLRWSEQP